MSTIDQTIKLIRPSLRHAAPQTYWFSLGFGLFNVIVGTALFNVQILFTLQVVSVFPLKAWALLFVIHGLCMLMSLAFNSWKLTRALNVIGVAIKTAWWLELVAVTIVGRSPFLLYIWSLLLFFQIINCVYFMPRVNREQ